MVGVRQGAIVAALLAAGLSCGEKQDFQSCPMTQSMKDDCQAQQSQTQCSTYSSCAVMEHPQCPSGPCMIYQYRQVGRPDPYKTEPFCTFECSRQSPADCPAGSKCMPFLAGSYCVPNAYNMLTCVTGGDCSDQAVACCNDPDSTCQAFTDGNFCVKQTKDKKDFCVTDDDCQGVAWCLAFADGNRRCTTAPQNFQQCQ